MHLIVVLVVLIVVAVLVYKLMLQGGSGEGFGDDSKATYANDNALFPYYISRGKLFFKDKNQSTQQFHSKHIQELSDRLERRNQRHGWKKDTTFGTSFSKMQRGGFGRGVMQNDSIDAAFTSISQLNGNSILYFVKDSSFGALFRYEKEEDKELRLIHRQGLSLTDFSAANEDGKILCASDYSTGISNIAVMDHECDELRDLTSGDSVDTAPSWIVSEKSKVVYQSQGLARNPAGFVVGEGPAAINTLDVETGEIKTVFSESDYDYLMPKVSNDGSLYFIKRPYESIHYGSSGMFFDAILFPFRLLRAFFHYLNFFSMTYSQKPLTSASGPMIEQDAKELLIQGRRIDAEKALRQSRKMNGVPSLVPSSWQLIRCDKNGNQKVIERNVMSFSLLGNTVVYSNGCAIFSMDESGRKSMIHKDKLIEKFAI